MFPGSTCSRWGRYGLILCCVVYFGLARSGSAEEPARGFFGLTPVLVDGRVEVQSVIPEGPAEKAGVRPGDEILAFGGEPVPRRSQGDVFRAFTAYKEGETVEIVLRSGGSIRRVAVTLAPVPAATRDDQKRIEDAERRIRAAEVVEEILQAHDEIELALSDDGGLRFREPGDPEWTVLEPLAARMFEPVAARFLRSGKRSTVKLRVDREEDGSLALVPVD